MKPVTVVFQITAIGENVRSLNETVQSVLYWEQHTPSLCFRSLLWVVVEPKGYAVDPALYETLRESGAKVFVVPKEYRTPLGTQGKARALQYACDLRGSLDLSAPDVWIYHQDEETCVGQDTLLGISEFIERGQKLVGVGVILYPVDWSPIPSHVQELTRSYDDLRVLDSLTMPGNPTAGFHGSHFVVRADVEDSVGWDVSGYAPAEDLTFEIRVRARFGSVFGVLKGFAYEKGAFTMRDQLRQRRRWVRGIMFAFRRSSVLSRQRKVTIAYSAISWFSALPSVILLVASAFLRYGPLLLVTSLFTGFVWTSMATGYIEGALLHRQYVRQGPGLLRFFCLGIVGALADIFAPWYGLVTRTDLTDFVRKDRLPMSPTSRATAHRGRWLFDTGQSGDRPVPVGRVPGSRLSWGRPDLRPVLPGHPRPTASPGAARAEPLFYVPSHAVCRTCGRRLSQSEFLFYAAGASRADEPSCRKCLGRQEWSRFRLRAPVALAGPFARPWP